MHEDYSIVQSDTMRELTSQVRTSITEGWQVQGGIAVSIYTKHFNDGYGNRHEELFERYTQAMVKLRIS